MDHVLRNRIFGIACAFVLLLLIALLMTLGWLDKLWAVTMALLDVGLLVVMWSLFKNHIRSRRPDKKRDE